jgi:hypothetical protein
LCTENEGVFLTNDRAGIRNETTDEHRLTRIFAVFLTGFQDFRIWGHGNFFPGSACVPQAAFGILPDAGFRE